MNTFAERIRKERELRGWSQVFVAERLGLRRSATYANWEYGTREPDQAMQVAIAKLFDVTTDYLLGLSDNKKMTAAEFGIAREQDIDRLIRDVEEDRYGRSDGSIYDEDEKTAIIATLRRLKER